MNVDDNIIKGVAKFVSIVYESIEKYNDMKPETDEEELLLGAIIARYENIRTKITLGMCDSAKNFKQLFELFTDIQVYERQLESLNAPE
jgi:hypothetical protein